MTSESEPEDTFSSVLVWLDHSLFYLVNQCGATSWGDVLFPWLRERDSWIPLYVFIVLFVVWKERMQAWKWIVALAVLVALCDGITSHILKQLIWRDRPFSDESLPFTVRLLLPYKPANSSFPSSHASNHFGVGLFFYYTFNRYVNRWIAALFFVWAFVIIYAQVYVGVHFPIDVLAGALVGLSIAFAYCKLIKKYLFTT